MVHSASCSLPLYQFAITKMHQNYLRFLWWPSSPGYANFGLKQLANDTEKEYGSDVAHFLRYSFYVDDGLLSSASKYETVDIMTRTRAPQIQGQ